MNKRLIIAGGGASGLFAALNAAALNNNRTECEEAGVDLEIIVLDANDVPGKKILVTGNGRCNLCNTELDETKYYGSDSEFIKNVIGKFDSAAVMSTFAKLGISLKNKNGYIYPEAMQASAVSSALISTCQILGVKFESNCLIEKIDVAPNTENFHNVSSISHKVKVINTKGIDKIADNNTEQNVMDISNSDDKKDNPYHFTVYSSDGRVFEADYLILAYGSNAGLATDYTSGIQACVRRLGHKINPIIPALCSLYVDKRDKMYTTFFKKASGVRTEISTMLCFEDKIYPSYSGELQITDYGLSGIVIFQLSHIISEKIHKKIVPDMILKIDFFPRYTAEEMCSILKEQYFYEKKTLLDLFSGVMNAKLALGLLNLYSEFCDKGIQPHMKNIADKSLHDLILFMKNVPFKITGTNDIRHSQVCGGGVAVSEISANDLQSKIVENLYFCGECIDVDGLCGGYNLQWAWSTGYIAGHSVACKVKGVNQ